MNNKKRQSAVFSEKLTTNTLKMLRGEKIRNGYFKRLFNTPPIPKVMEAHIVQQWEHFQNNMIKTMPLTFIKNKEGIYEYQRQDNYDV